MLKRADIAVHDTIESVANGQEPDRTERYGLHNGGVGLSRSGGFLDQQAADIDAWTQRIARGEIDVPCLPDRRLDQARLLGLTQAYCMT